jgi:hypothetical protein
MTNIDSNELSANELDAVSGGEYTFLPPAPSKQTVQVIGAGAQNVANLVGGPIAVAASAIFSSGRVTGHGDD